MLQQSSPNHANTLPSPLRLFLLLIVLGTLASWIFAWICHLKGLPNPYAWPYYHVALGADFTSYRDRFALFHTMQFFTAPGEAYLYPAPLAMFYKLLFHIWGGRAHPVIVLWLFISLVAFIVSSIYSLALRRRKIPLTSGILFSFALVLFSYPAYFLIQRGNVEICVWIFTLTAVSAYRKDRLLWSAVLLGIAIALKWYPILLLGFFLSQRKYKAISIALTTAVATTLASALILGPTLGVAMRETLNGTSKFLDIYAKHYVYENLGYDHSFFGFFRAIAQPFHPDLSTDLNRYMALAAIAGTLIYFLRIRRLPVLNQISVLVILAITLPPVSFDYTLLHLYIPFGLFSLYLIDAQRAGRTVPHAKAIMFWFAFIMVPHGYIIIRGERYCGQFRFLGLMALLYIFLRHPFPEPADQSDHSASLSQLTLKGNPA